MADLQTAASEALTAVKDLEGEIETADDRMNSLRSGNLATLEEQSTAAWSRFQEELGEFMQAVPVRRSLLEELGGGALRDIDAAREAASQAYQAAEASIEKMTAAVADLETAVEACEPQLQTMVDEFKTAAEALGDAVDQAEQSLEDGFRDLREFIGETAVTAVREMREEANERAEALGTAIDEQKAALEAQFADWQQKLDEVVQTASQAFTDASEHVAEVAEFSVEECARLHQEALDPLVAKVGEAREALESLRHDVEELEQQSQDAGKALDDGVSETIAALDSASSTLADVLQILARYSFVVL